MLDDAAYSAKYAGPKMSAIFQLLPFYGIKDPLQIQVSAVVNFEEEISTRRLG